MRTIIKKIYEFFKSEPEISGCMGGAHASLELVRTDSYGKMMFYCKQCGRFEQY
jgi:hypothetical protein